MINLDYNSIYERLVRLDEDAGLLFDTDTRYQIIVVGGSSLVLQRLGKTATQDIDSIDVSKELSPLLEKYDINTYAEAYINNFPYNYEDRLILLFEGNNVNVYVMSLEDVVISKLCASRPPDIIDITAPDVIAHLNWDILHHLATDEYEAKASALNDRNYNIFKDAYYDYVKEYKPCDS